MKYDMLIRKLNTSLNASFTPEISSIKKGDIALISQSGGMPHILGFLAVKSNLGFSKIIGIGNRLNIDFAEILEYLSNDNDTRIIALYYGRHG